MRPSVYHFPIRHKALILSTPYTPYTPRDATLLIKRHHLSLQTRQGSLFMKISSTTRRSSLPLELRFCVSLILCKFPSFLSPPYALLLCCLCYTVQLASCMGRRNMSTTSRGCRGCSSVCRGCMGVRLEVYIIVVVTVAVILVLVQVP